LIVRYLKYLQIGWEVLFQINFSKHIGIIENILSFIAIRTVAVGATKL